MAMQVLPHTSKWLFVGVTLLFCPTASELAARSAAGPVGSTQLSRELDGYFSKAAAEGFNGVVLVERDGRVIFRKAYGWSDREAKLRSSAGGVYAIGSLQKQFTATAVLKLASQRKLQSDRSNQSMVSECTRRQGAHHCASVANSHIRSAKQWRPLHAANDT